MSYGWIIDVDHFDGGAVGIFGPSRIPASISLKLKSKKRPGKKFRLLDDDYEIMAEGRYLGDESENMFGPLNDFGEGYYGCTMIEYWEEDRWVMI